MDVVDPVVLTSSPASGVQGADPAVSSVVIRFSESMDRRSVHPEGVRVEDVTIPLSPVLLPPLPGRPTLVGVVDGTTLPNDGVEVLWTGAKSSPSQSRIRVTVLGLDAEPTGAIVLRDLSGKGLSGNELCHFGRVSGCRIARNEEDRVFLTR